MNRLTSFLIIILAISLMPGIILAAHYSVAISSFAFNPESLNVRVGDTVTWTNNDAVNHTSTSNTGVWNSGILTTGHSYSFTFAATGHFPYHCAVHLSMHGVVVVTQVTGIDDPTGKGLVPDKLGLMNYPNPFNAQTRIDLNLPQAGHVTLDIYDITGRLAKNLLNEYMPAGLSTVIWDGTDSKGNPAATGVYFIRAQTDAQATIRRAVLLK